MRNQHLPIFALVSLALLSLGYFLTIAPKDAALKDALLFSNTGTWDVALSTRAQETLTYKGMGFDSILLPPPPRNSSKRVSDELSYLKGLSALRTAKDIRDIYLEINHDTTYFAGTTLATYTDGKSFPATSALLRDSYHDLTIIIMRNKKFFDRVRPSLLDPEIVPAVPVPGHPAYPSGHSAQMHYVAYVLSELAPARRAEFIARADQIAHNREIAGLHYPSDSAAGVLLAQQFFDIMMQNEEFTTLLTAAKAEWATHPELVQAPANP